MKKAMGAALAAWTLVATAPASSQGPLMHQTRTTPKSEKALSFVPISDRRLELVQGDVLSWEKSGFTLNFGLQANARVNKQADIFGVYVVSPDYTPTHCIDVQGSNEKPVPYQKIGTYSYRFNFMGHERLFQAIRDYRCVAIANTFNLQ